MTKARRSGDVKLGDKWKSPIELSVPGEACSVKLSFWGYLLENIKISGIN